MNCNEREQSVAFTGYRSSKLSQKLSNECTLEEISKRCRAAICEAVDCGYRSFLTGMSDGFDLLAAREVLRLKEEGVSIDLIAVIPFRGQELGYSEESKMLYDEVLDNADRKVILAESYVDGDQYLVRNNYLVNNSSYLICYYDGERGGTMYTYHRALKSGHKIVNLAPLPTPKNGELAFDF